MMYTILKSEQTINPDSELVISAVRKPTKARLQHELFWG